MSTEIVVMAQLREATKGTMHEAYVPIEAAIRIARPLATVVDQLNLLLDGYNRALPHDADDDADYIAEWDAIMVRGGVRAEDASNRAWLRRLVDEIKKSVEAYETDIEWHPNAAAEERLVDNIQALVARYGFVRPKP